MWPSRSVSVAGRAALVVPLALLGLFVTVRTTASAALTIADPQLAVSLDNSNSQALELAGTIAVGEATADGARRALELAKLSLIASPMSSQGAAVLGAARSVLSPDADVLPAFTYSNVLSRRTALTQIWLINHRSAIGDIFGTLRSYDFLFRVHDFYRAQFLPLLLAASSDPEIARPLARILAEGPAWRFEFFGGLLAKFPGPENFVLFVEATKLDPQTPEGARNLSLAMMRLVESARPELALQIYEGAAGSGKARTLVRNGNFRLVGNLTPFDWNLTQSDELSAQQGLNDTNMPVLFLANNGGRAGALARQLLVLPPNRYSLKFTVGNVAGATVDVPQMVVQCVADTHVLASTIFATADSAGRDVVGSFEVPVQGCLAQWLIVESGKPIDAIANQWISNIEITPVVEARKSPEVRPSGAA